VTNNKFAGDFEAWAALYAKSNPSAHIEIINDQSTGDADKLGAIGDINLVIQKAGLENSDLMVVAGDNLFSQSLEQFGSFCREKNQPVLALYDVGSLDEARKYGVVAVDQDGVISSFEEKPQQPKSTLIGIALYYYPLTP
jgi:glucose-1-phosphate thymidylyltransferase